ncbi:hypothetical protein [Nocardioides convexus]|uniref:hypothetical protein n=1 Tax=Nocardioides convexus TaxID=2712224 RepID=UPI0024185696|nr:hypothetical protein [Nocardioides convexus]
MAKTILITGASSGLGAEMARQARGPRLRRGPGRASYRAAGGACARRSSPRTPTGGWPWPRST